MHHGVSQEAEFLNIQLQLSWHGNCQIKMVFKPCSIFELHVQDNKCLIPSPTI